MAQRSGARRSGMVRRWWPRRVALALGVLCAAAALLVLIPFGWTRWSAAGHRYPGPDAAPSADVALVLGAQVAPGSGAPMPFLRGRLDTAADLLRAGRVRVLLVSGDQHGGSGDETAVMTGYLTGVRGVDPARVVTDPDGRDTYDSCLRARTVYGLTRLLVVTQQYHLARAVALCRHVGIDADGVAARCVDCRRSTLARNALRDFVACGKAAWDVLRDRPPAVASPPSDAVRAALRGS